MCSLHKQRSDLCDHYAETALRSDADRQNRRSVKSTNRKKSDDEDDNHVTPSQKFPKSHQTKRIFTAFNVFSFSKKVTLI